MSSTTATIRLPDAGLPPAAEALRGEVREFLRVERDRGTIQSTSDAWLAGFDAGFSGRLGDRGWLGMTWPP